MVRGFHRKSWRWRSVSITGHTRKHFLGFRFGTSKKSGIEEAQYLYSLPERTKLRSVQENQDYKGSLQEAHWRSSTSSRKVWWLDNSRSQSFQWRMWISKQSPIRSRGTRLSHSMDTIIPAQNENFRRRKRAYKSFSSRRKSRKSFTLTIHWNLAKRVNYHGIIVHQHLTDRKTDGIAERAVRRIRKGRLLYCRDRAWMKHGWLIPRNVTDTCEFFKTSCQMGKHFTNGDSENHSKDQ